MPSPRLAVGASASLSTSHKPSSIHIKHVSQRRYTKIGMPPQLGQALAITPSPHQPKEIIYRYAITESHVGDHLEVMNKCTLHCMRWKIVKQSMAQVLGIKHIHICHPPTKNEPDIKCAIL